MATNKEWLAQEVAKAVGAGKVVALETVDFNDPNRPKTCLEVDFPILPVNAVSALEATTGATKKPVYQVSKWWARRQPSVFRSMLIAAATKSPENSSHAAKLVWDNYYANHQKRGAFKDLKVADIFMGGGTTLVEGSRLGMQMFGNDLNPVAWFVVKQGLTSVDIEEVKQLLADIEAEVKPQIIPYYYCDGPNGEKGTWTYLPTNRVMPPDFDPLTIPREERHEYNYKGPEIIYTLWAKHGPCQVTGCGHRTPIMSNPVMAVKTLTVKHWERTCKKCGERFHVEAHAARIAPDVPLYVAPSEYPFTVYDFKKGIVCPHCGHAEHVNLSKGKNKKIQLTLLTHPEWLAGSPQQDDEGRPYGGSAQDDAESTARWNQERASKIRLLEVRGILPDEVTCPDTGITFRSDLGTVPKRSNFTCGICGTVQDILSTVRPTGKTAPMAAYALQGYSPVRNKDGFPYSGRFFAPFTSQLARQYDFASHEWEVRRNDDLKDYWPRSVVPSGFNTDQAINHLFTHWWTMFNPRQLLVHTQLLKAIVNVGEYDLNVREYVLGAFQQYLRNQCLFSIWDYGADQLTPALSNNNFHPKSTTVENCVFGKLGRGNWLACSKGLIETLDYHENPWDNVSNKWLQQESSIREDFLSGKTTKVYSGDHAEHTTNIHINCNTSTDLLNVVTGSIDLVITDPPFGGLLHYSELSDFFYVWLRLALKDRYPDYFGSEYTPKSLEVVANKAREPEDSDGYYQRLLTQCWREAHRILKPGGMLAFTFHHSEDEPWVAVLESLFEAGFYLEATYPIRSDETKGEGEFGSKTIEYDIIHVCRKRIVAPTPVSWGRMRREVMADVRQIQQLLENHAKEGLPAADIQVIRRGKALEYFSRHYGKVYIDDDRTISVRDALLGINQLIDEDADKGKDLPPVNAEPITRQFLRIFGNALELKRDQMQKFLKGSITTPDDFEQRGWCIEKSKVFIRTNPLDFAREWSGKHRRRLTSDLDQALVLIGACYDGSGINAADTLRNDNFKPHVALKPLLEWLYRNAPDQPISNAASRAITIFNAWNASRSPLPKQILLFGEEDEP
jgi:adenine-specific DNA methylase